MPSRNTILLRINKLREQHRADALKYLAISITILILVSQIVPSVQDYVIKFKVIEYATLLLLVDLSFALEKGSGDKSVRILEKQDDVMDTLIAGVPGTPKIELLEYAGATTLPLIRAIRKYNVPVHILIKHPETVSGMQRQRTIATIDTLYNSIFDNYTGYFEIRCYKLPYSLRARHFQGKMLELGWLTPDLARKTTYGSGNPLILFDLRHSGHDSVRDFFSRTFNDYWNNPETEDALHVLKRLDEAQIQE